MSDDNKDIEFTDRFLPHYSDSGRLTMLIHIHVGRRFAHLLPESAEPDLLSALEKGIAQWCRESEMGQRVKDWVGDQGVTLTDVEMALSGETDSDLHKILDEAQGFKFFSLTSYIEPDLTPIDIANANHVFCA